MNIAFETANPRLQNILSRLKGVKKVGPNTYRAYSPLRDEKEPSLYITEKSDGTILMCDHGGGDTKATLAAIGLTMCILFPSGGSEGSGLKALPPHERLPPSTSTLTKTENSLQRKSVIRTKTSSGAAKSLTAATTTINRRMFPCTMGWYWKRRKQSSWLKARKT